MSAVGARTICLLGAESTGKTQLAGELAAHFTGRGLRAIAVAEVLREWCVRAGRTPRPEEQLAIAQEQERRVDSATGAADLVIADTSALMVAIYGGMLFEDGALYRYALQCQSRYDATLVTGLDLPWVADGLQRADPQLREPTDALVRSALQRARVPYQLVYGHGPQRLQAALAALQALDIATGAPPVRTDQRPWVWMCDKCSDPECEHRLFKGL